jgi:hypothetical protein
MKHFKLITITLSLIFISLGNFASSQVRLPLSSGSYKVLTDTYYDKVEVVGQKITTYKNGSLVGTFIAVEERLGQYILIVAKVDYLSENECRLTLTQPNGTREKVTIQKQ